MVKMAYEYYMSSFPATPTTQQQYWKDGLQDMINRQFYDASDVYTIGEELTKGTLVFTDTDVRLNHIIEANTGEKWGDDFRNIVFKDLTHPKGMGFRYSFDDNVWICVNTDNYKFVTASAIIRRCNNTLNFNYEGSTPVEEPCVVDYKYSGIDINFNTNLNLSDGDIFVIAQYNDITKDIEINKRFMFGGQTFKVKAIDNFLRMKTADENSIPLISMFMRLDQVNIGLDDIENNIADNDTSFPWS
jgi:hypothetical protein